LVDLASLSKALGENKWAVVVVFGIVGYMIYNKLLESWTIFIPIGMLILALASDKEEPEYNLIKNNEAQRYALLDVKREVNKGSFGFDLVDFKNLRLRILDAQTKLRTVQGKPQFWEVVTRIDPLGITILTYVYPFREPEHMLGFIVGSGTKRYGHDVWVPPQREGDTSLLNTKKETE
jgi:hypothetical protein